METCCNAYNGSGKVVLEGSLIKVSHSVCGKF